MQSQLIFDHYGRQEALREEVKVLKAQLGDYNMVMEKVTACSFVESLHNGV